MNKTKEEILEHLKTRGYTDDASRTIVGYLFGKDITTHEEFISIKSGDYLFKDFLAWLESEDNEETSDKKLNEDDEIFISIFDDICDRALEAETLGEIERYIKQIDWLIETFVESEEDGESE